MLLEWVKLRVTGRFAVGKCLSVNLKAFEKSFYYFIPGFQNYLEEKSTLEVEP